MISDAVGLERASTVVGYKLTTGNFQESSPNLPQRVVVLAEANADNQLNLDLTKKQYVSAKDAGDAYGYGSPIYNILRILFPFQGGGLGGIPVLVIPQAEAAGATEKVIEITPTGTATANGTHTLVIAGRKGLDGVFYDLNINIGDSSAEITAKISDAINNVLGCPFTCDDDDYVATATSKWKGLTAEELNISVDTGNNDLGLVYAVNSVQAGSGTPSIAPALAQFGSEWITLVVNSYGTHENTMAALEAFNGIPDPVNPTGRFVGIVMKPFVALTGTIEEDPSAISDARPNEVTIALCPAPLSKGLSMEAAANYCVKQAVISQNSPHLDVQNTTLPDMPVPSDGNIGAMSDYANRDLFIGRGCSTVELSAGRYTIKDFVTTYHKVGENPPQFRYVRNLFLDFNIRYTYYLYEQINVVDHAIADDAAAVSATKVVKPKQWKQVLSSSFATELERLGLIVEKAFLQNSIQDGLGTSNPDRFETFFRYKRSGFARISSTTAEAGFNFGTLS